MASQTGTMSPFYSDEYLEPSHLLRKVILLFLLVIALAFGLAILLREKHDYPLILQKLFSDICLAVAAGFGSRFIIRNQPGFVRAVAAMSSYIVGLYVLGYESKWKYGMGPIVFWPKEVGWDGLAQLGIGVFLFLLVFRAWSRSRLNVGSSSPTYGSRRGGSNVQVVHSRGSNLSMDHSHTDVPPVSGSMYTWPTFGSAGTKSIRSARSSVRSKPKVNRGGQQALVVKRPAANQKRRGGFLRRKPQIELALVEEHRCPYCLETVQRADPRGTVECEVCHTLHHRDCWEITGTCQVPHLNT